MNRSELQYLKSVACENIIKILDHFNIEYIISDKYVHFACPVHNGDNNRGSYWNLSNSTWKCMTRYCHEECKDVIGLIGGILQEKENKKISFFEACRFIKSFFNIKIDNIKNIEIKNDPIDNIVKTFKKIKNKPKKITKKVKIESILDDLIFDDFYFTSRGYTKEIIEKYFICKDNKKRNSFPDRCFFPTLDENGEYILGWSGRSIYNECYICNLYHDNKIRCPENSNNKNYAKWLHSYNFRKQLCLYNYNNAKSYIKNESVAIICESPSDVWMYEQHGIHNSVAVFGCSISKYQKLLLQKTGCLTLILNFDNDDAGKRATERAIKYLSDYFQIKYSFIDGKKQNKGFTKDFINKTKDMIKKSSKLKVSEV